MSLRTTRLVIEREVRESARRRSMWITIVLVFLGSAAISLAPEFFPDGGGGGTVAIVGDDDLGVTSALDTMRDPEIDTVTADDPDAATAMIDDGDADLALLLDETPPVVLTEEEGSLSTIVSQVVASRLTVTALTGAGLDTETISAAFDNQPTIELADDEREGRRFSAFVIALVLYLLTLMLTSQVANGVAVEKANRVSEVLLAIVPPRSMLFGKVIGVGFIGVFTLLVATTPPIVRFAVGADLPPGFGTTAVASAAWFVLGLALYLMLGGVLGSTVARQEEVGAVVGPLTMLLVAGYLVAVAAPESTLAALLAYIPLTSPMVVPSRIAIDAAGPAELFASIVILAASVWVLARVGTEVFRRAIVRTGGRLKLSDLRDPRA